MNTFTPGSGTERAFRDTLGCFGTGVTVVTATGPRGPVGITANSFASVSLDPPLVLWSPARLSDRFSVFTSVKHSVINVLSDDQHELAMSFARSGEAPFEHGNWVENAEGAPILPEAMAHFECEAYAAHDGGDHVILVNRVLRAAHRDGSPLLFSRGKFGTFAPNG